MTDLNLTAYELRDILASRVAQLHCTNVDEQARAKRLISGIRAALDLYEETSAIEAAERKKELELLNARAPRPAQSES